MNDNYLYAKELQRERNNKYITEEMERKAKYMVNDIYAERESIRESMDRKRNEYFKFKSAVRQSLLEKALSTTFIGCIKNPDKKLSESIIHNYVEQVGVDQLLTNMDYSQSAYLRSIKEAVTKYTNIMMEDVDKEDPETLVYDDQKAEEFVKELEGKEDVEDIENTIRIRVANAEEDFVNRLNAEKEDIKEIIQTSAERIKNAVEQESDDDEDMDDEDSDDDDDSEDNDMDDEEIEDAENDENVEKDVKECHIMDAKRKVAAVKERPKSVFYRMVRNLSESALKDKYLRDKFSSNGGRLDMHSIVESVRYSYTLLEMVSSLRIEKVDSKYIEDTIKSM